MKKAASMKLKVNADGSRITLSLTPQRLEAFAKNVKDPAERAAIESALATARENDARVSREKRMATPLSIESLIPLGWMLVGSHDPLAYGAIREGDFRWTEINGVGGWAFGPPGAFDREPEGTRILRSAVQAGVMSEIHMVYRLMEPASDRSAAIAQALDLETAWRRALPPKFRKPKAIDELGHKVARADWPRYMMEDADLEGLPEGARLAATGDGRAKDPAIAFNVDDIVHRCDPHVTINVFRCDAVLRHHSRYDHDGGYYVTGNPKWFVLRHHNPRFDSPIRPGDEIYHLPIGPYACVIGNVWGTVRNMRTQAPPMESVFFPLATKDEADAAAVAMAVGLGILEGEVPALPEPISTPQFGAEPLLEVA